MDVSKKHVGYIYCVTNTVNNKKYIGQTIRSIKRRWSAHQTEAKSELNPSYFHKAILKYGSNNFNIEEIMRIEGNSKEELKQELDKLEIKYIEGFNTIRPNGYNITPGGNSVSITRYRKVVQISKHGDIVRVYDSISSALRELDIPEGSLSSVLCGITKTAHGYYWRYQDDESLPSFIDSISCPYVAMYDADGTLEKVYDNYSDAAKCNAVKVARIKQCCNGERNHSKQKRFRAFLETEDIPSKIEPLVVEWGKGIRQYDFENNLIAEYKNLKDVLLKNADYTASTIRNCCNGARSKAYNYVWKYV